MQQKDQIFRKCEHPDCECEGKFRAPKNRNLNSYYWFCLEHVTEYNKSWNYYDGMSEEEIAKENKADETWHNPTWKFGVSFEELKKAGNLKDPFEIYDKFIKGAKTVNSNFYKKEPAFTAQEQQAIDFFSLKIPFTKEELKTKYKMLVKKYHPDVNKGSKKLENLFTKTVDYYKLLIKKL